MSVAADARPVARVGEGLRLYALAVGAIDTLTGLALIASPLSTLRWMWIPTPPAEPIWLRFIGAFVTGVGLVYLYPLIGRSGRRATTILTVLELTAVMRASVGTFVGASILAGALPAAWSSVTLTDLGLATFQAVALRRRTRNGGAT